MELNTFGLGALFNFNSGHLVATRCIKVRTVCAGLRVSLKGFCCMCHEVPSVQRNPGSSLSFPVLKVLTVPLAPKEEASALPWRRIFYSRWQLWQLVMAACWWESQALLPLPVLPSPALSSYSLLHRENLKSQKPSFFFCRCFDCRTMRWKTKKPILFAAKERNPLPF